MSGDTTFVYKTTQVGSDWLNQINRQIFAAPTAATLRTLGTLSVIDSTRVYSRARTLGYYTPGDGGGAEYYFDPNDTTSTDNGGSVFVDQAGGRWKIATSTRYSVLQFGAKGDSNGTAGNGTDDTTAIVNAIAALPSTGGTVRVPGGHRCRITSTITLPFPGHYTLEGDGGCESWNNVGPSEIVVDASVTGDGIKLSGPFSRLRDLMIRGVSSGSANNVRIAANNCGIDNCGITLAGQDNVRIGADTGTNVNVNSWHVNNCAMTNPKRYNLYIHDGTFTVQPNTNGGIASNNLYQGDQTNNDGIRVDAGELNTFIGGAIEDNGGVALRFNGAHAKYNTVLGTDFDSGNLSGQCRCEAGATNNQIMTPTILDTQILDFGADNTWIVSSSTPGHGSTIVGPGRVTMATSGGACDIIAGSTSSEYLRLLAGGVSSLDNSHAALLAGSSGGAPTLGFFGAAAVVRPTTGIAGAAFVAGSGTAVNDASTFGGYTIKQMAAALKQVGILT